MKKLNALMGALLLGVSIGSVSAADIMQGNDAAAVSSAITVSLTVVDRFKASASETVKGIGDKIAGLYARLFGKKSTAVAVSPAVETVEAVREVVEVAAPEVIPEVKLITLSAVKNDPNVTVLIALRPLSEGARPSVSACRGVAGSKARNLQINGVAYDLWSAGENNDVEKHGGCARYTFFGFGDCANETWNSNYYLPKQGVEPGESGNAIDMTGKISDIKGTVYVFLGESFLDQTDASVYDNHQRNYNQGQVNAARERALAARKSSVK